MSDTRDAPKKSPANPTKTAMRDQKAASISPPPGWRSPAAWIASLDARRRQRFLNGLSPNALAALPWIFEFWARRETQLPPPGDWTVWVALGGRGAGKTRTGAEWIRTQVEGAHRDDPGRCRRIALLSETADQARDVMVFGDSGLMAVTPPDRRPAFQATRRRLLWPNGAEARLFSAADPESLRGPQFDAAWSDELGKWRRAQEAWDMLQFGLRLGERPRQIVTTTPRRNKTLIDILASPGAVKTVAPTTENQAFLAADFLEKIVARYQGSTLGRQELEGELILEAPGALWSRAMLDGGRVQRRPAFDRIVVAVDPPAAAHAGSDACGIVVAGGVCAGPPLDWRAVVLADWSVQGASPQGWAARAVAAYRAYSADRLVAEVNQGGDMVAAILSQLDPSVAVKSVRAAHGKRARAEPVAALYEQGRVSHLGRLDALEDQMCAFTRGARGETGSRSPDRVDALVWAITDLLLAPENDPHVRAL